MFRVHCKRRWAWAMAVLLVVLSAAASAAPRVALVIGNASYTHAPALANPLNDAADIGTALERLGFAVTRLENVGDAEMRRGLKEFRRAASASEVAVVFYAGHGIEVDGRNFLVPVDARLASDQDVEYEAVPLELVSRAVERASGLRLVVLDACRENPFAVNIQRAGATRSIGRGLARVEPSGETLVAYAAKEGTVASDGEGRNSPYSAALLAHLEEPGLEVMFMFRKVRDAVLASTGGRQEPFMYGSLSSQGVYLAAGPLPEPSPPVQSLTTAETESARVVAERELLFWESVKDSEHPADIQLYLDRYPDGIYEPLARNQLDRLEGGPKDVEAAAPDGGAVPAQDESSVSARLEAARLEAEREFWASVKGSDDPADIQAYLDQYPGGTYEILARNRLKKLDASNGPAPQESSSSTSRVEQIPSASAVPSPETVEASLELDRSQLRRIQKGLATLGFDPGPVDGLLGAKTGAAVGLWQESKGHTRTGRLDREQAAALIAIGDEALRKQVERGRTARLARETEEREFWNSVKDSEHRAQLRSYLDRYPNGKFAVLARNKRKRLEQAAERQAAATKLPSGPNWFVTRNKKCTVWFWYSPVYLRSHPPTWSGDCVDGKASGEGRLVFLSNVYSGTMNAGKYHHGTEAMGSGDRKEGQWRDGKLHGWGIFVNAHGGRYEGQWQNDKPYGQGTYVHHDGRRYEGHWDGCLRLRNGKWLSYTGTLLDDRDYLYCG